MTAKKPNLIILLGAPGSGKTHVAEHFCQDNDFVHVNSDSVRAGFIAEPTFTSEEREQVYIKIHQVISEKLSNGDDVVFDGNLLTNQARFEALDKYQNMGVRVLFVFLDTPSETAIKRASSRKTRGNGLYNLMPKERVVRMHSTFERPDPMLPQVVITDTDDHEKVHSAIIKALNSV